MRIILDTRFSENKALIAIMILGLILTVLGKMNLGGAVIITAYWCFIKIFTWSERSSFRFQASPLIMMISIALFAHKIPGFHNILFYDNVIISPASAPYSAYINFDKPFLILLLTYYYARNNSSTNIVKASYQSLILGIIAAFMLLIPALITGYLKFDPKIPSIIIGWSILNLITVLAEEAFFRGFIQSALNEVLSVDGSKYYQLLSLLITSVLFGISHHAGGHIYMFLSFVAGVFYGYAMILTKRIEASILVHFTVNLVHILLFTYPYAS